jgi:hypothetical protein
MSREELENQLLRIFAHANTRGAYRERVAYNWLRWIVSQIERERQDEQERNQEGVEKT